LRQRNPTNPENLCWAVPALRLPFDFAAREGRRTAGQALRDRGSRRVSLSLYPTY